MHQISTALWVKHGIRSLYLSSREVIIILAFMNSPDFDRNCTEHTTISRLKWEEFCTDDAGVWPGRARLGMLPIKGEDRYSCWLSPATLSFAPLPAPHASSAWPVGCTFSLTWPNQISLIASDDSPDASGVTVISWPRRGASPFFRPERSINLTLGGNEKKVSRTWCICGDLEC